MSEYPDIWLFDQNRRVYKEGGLGGPIWLEHWAKADIKGETTRSWINSWGKKISKKGGRGIAFSWEEIEKLAFIKDNSYKISDAVGRIDDFDKLTAVAELIGYKPKEND